MNEPAWIEHDGSAVCPVPAGTDCEVKYRDGSTFRDEEPRGHVWHNLEGQSDLDITHYRDWTAFRQEQPKMSKDDVPENPPAFPNTGNSSWSMSPTEGMTLRDWFAGKHLSTLPEFHIAGCDDEELDEIAVQIYRMADAMLRARGVTATDGPRCAAKIGE